MSGSTPGRSNLTSSAPVTPNAPRTAQPKATAYSESKKRAAPAKKKGGNVRRNLDKSLQPTNDNEAATTAKESNKKEHVHMKEAFNDPLNKYFSRIALSGTGNESDLASLEILEQRAHDLRQFVIAKHEILNAKEHLPREILTMPSFAEFFVLESISQSPLAQRDWDRDNDILPDKKAFNALYIWEHKNNPLFKYVGKAVKNDRRDVRVRSQEHINYQFLPRSRRSTLEYALAITQKKDWNKIQVIPLTEYIENLPEVCFETPNLPPYLNSRKKEDWIALIKKHEAPFVTERKSEEYANSVEETEIDGPNYSYAYLVDERLRFWTAEKKKLAEEKGNLLSDTKIDFDFIFDYCENFLILQQNTKFPTGLNVQLDNVWAWQAWQAWKTSEPGASLNNNNINNEVIVADVHLVAITSGPDSQTSESEIKEVAENEENLDPADEEQLSE